MRRRLRIGLTVLAACVFGAVLTSTAAAVTRLGPDLTPVQNGGASYGCQAGIYSPCSFVSLRSSDPAVLVAAPFSGVITQWRFRGACCTEIQTEPKTMTLKTFLQGTQDGKNGYGWIVPRTTGPSFVIPPGNQVISDPEVSLPARVSITAGERIGIVADNPISFATYSAPSSVLTIVANGQEQNGEFYGVAYTGAMAINADVEPDADGDGYGDETQDCQTSDPAQHGTECVPVPTSPTPPAPLVSTKQGRCEGVCKGGGVVFSRPPQSFPGPRGDGGIYVPLRCPQEAAIPCGGILYAELPGAKKPRASFLKKAAPKILAKAKYSVSPGKKKTVKLDFSAKTERFLALKRSRRVTVTIVPNQGQTTSTIQTLKFPKPKKKH